MKCMYLTRKKLIGEMDFLWWYENASEVESELEIRTYQAIINDGSFY